MLSASSLTASFLTTWHRRERMPGGEMCRSQAVEGAGPGFGRHVAVACATRAAPGTGRRGDWHWVGSDSWGGGSLG